jgi:hypothetical protein
MKVVHMPVVCMVMVYMSAMRMHYVDIQLMKHR